VSLLAPPPGETDAGMLPVMLILASVLFNAPLAIINAHVVQLNMNVVAGSEFLIVLVAQATAFKHYNQQMLPWYGAMVFIVGFAIIRGSYLGTRRSAPHLIGVSQACVAGELCHHNHNFPVRELQQFQPPISRVFDCWHRHCACRLRWQARRDLLRHHRAAHSGCAEVAAHRPEQIRFTHGLCTYVALTMMISYSLFSKTAALLWFIHGSLQRREARVPRPATKERPSAFSRNWSEVLVPPQP